MTRSLDLSLCSSSGSLSFEEEKPHVLCECRPIWDVGGSCDTGVPWFPHGGKQCRGGPKVPPPAADYVSKKLSLFFSSHGQQYQVQAARGTAFHRKLVRTLANGALAYEEVEIANNEGF